MSGAPAAGGQAAPGPIPDDRELASLLRDVLGTGPVKLIERSRAAVPGKSHTEVITCEVAGEGRRRLFCKHSVGGGSSAFGHRGGPDREASAYTHLLASLDLRAARFRGIRASGHRTLLVLDYVEGAVPMNEVADATAALDDAARWAGSLHSQSAGWKGASSSRLPRYDASYYRGWSDRLVAFTAHFGAHGTSWLRALCKRFGRRAAEELAAAPVCAVHGEYYPDNLLVCGTEVFPVDWESAAVAPGEIDLATLTQHWWPAAVESAERAYVAARWPGGAPADHARILLLARVYVVLRWLGERQDWTLSEPAREYFDELFHAGSEAGLV